MHCEALLTARYVVSYGYCTCHSPGTGEVKKNYLVETGVDDLVTDGLQVIRDLHAGTDKITNILNNHSY